MRFLYLKLVGYIGIYNGLGLKEIEIDFSKCRNNVTVISGPNGKGKSTLINALNILPDGNENFYPGMTCSKTLVFSDGQNTYQMNSTHPIDKYGNRATTKVSLLKNGIELNPNGNVSSYKEIIFDELDIDSNFLSLSKITGNNRGLADKRPADRKKMISSIISSLETYNNIYKVLNKKANTYKSYVNNLSSKLQAIGDEQLLISTNQSLCVRKKSLEDQIEECKNKLTENNTILKMNNTDTNLQEKYNNLTRMIELKEQEIKNIMLVIKRKQDSLYTNESEISKEFLENDAELIRKSIESNKANLDAIEVSVLSLTSMIDSINDDIIKLELKISESNKDIDEALDQNMETYTKYLKDIENAFNEYGLVNTDSLSSNDVNTAINLFTKIKNDINYVYQLLTPDQMNAMYTTYHGNDIDNINNNISIANELYIKKRDELSKIEADIKIVDILKNRPNNCKIDSCPIIKDAIDISSNYTDIYREYDFVDSELFDIRNSIDSYKNELEVCQKEKEANDIIEGIISSINSNRELLSHFSLISKQLFGNIRELILVRQYRFDELDRLQSCYDVLNNISEYKNTLRIVNELKTRYEIQKNNKKVLNSYIAELEEKNAKLNELKESYNVSNKNKQTSLALQIELNNKLDSIMSILSQYNTLSDLVSENEKMKEELESISIKFKSSMNIMTDITALELELKMLNNELVPVQNELKTIESKLTMAESYKQEYSDYSQKYMYVDTLRKYSSPTSGSIQSLFMSIYMDKTLDTVNQLLGMLFNGHYRIAQYIINEDEFRIPFIGDGLMVDDISSGSTSQVCMMGLIINLVLSHMCSSKYNIVSLDEIDGGLDSSNRYMFVDVLQKICSILDIGQLFIISHSIESSLNNVDVILLSNTQEYIDQFSHANVIYMIGN